MMPMKAFRITDIILQVSVIIILSFNLTAFTSVMGFVMDLV